MLVGSNNCPRPCNATPQSGNESVDRKPGRRWLVSRYIRNGRTPMTTASIVQPSYATPFSKNPRPFPSKVKIKLIPASNKNPRHGFCVPMNHAPKTAPVHAPSAENTKPSTKIPVIATAANFNKRLGVAFVVIPQLFLEALWDVTSIASIWHLQAFRRDRGISPVLSTEQPMRLSQLLRNLQPLRTMRHASPARRALPRVQRQSRIQPASPLHIVVIPGIPLIAQNLRNRQPFLAPRHALIAQPANFPVRVRTHHFDGP